MHFTETDEVKLEAILLDQGKINSANGIIIKAIMKNIEAGNGYEPVKIFHDLDHDTYTLTKGLETYMACWKLGHEWIKAEISF